MDKFSHLLNIIPIVLTFEVSNAETSIELNFTHFENIASIFSTFLVLKLVIFNSVIFEQS